MLLEDIGGILLRVVKRDVDAERLDVVDFLRRAGGGYDFETVELAELADGADGLLLRGEGNGGAPR